MLFKWEFQEPGDALWHEENFLGPIEADNLADAIAFMKRKLAGVARVNLQRLTPIAEPTVFVWKEPSNGGWTIQQ